MDPRLKKENTASVESLELSSQHREFERRLYYDLEELDDPLELFLEYISWAHKVLEYLPDCLQDVVERCLLYIIEIGTYENDPRFVRLCLWYMDRFWGSDLNECLKICRYFYCRGVGRKLAMFYEELANLLESMNKFSKAFEMTKLGLQNNARPRSRLDKVHAEFQTKLREHSLTSNAIPLDWFSDEIPEFKKRREKYDKESGIAVSGFIVAPEKKSRKLTVLSGRKDMLDDRYDICKLIEAPGKKTEKIYINFSLLYKTEAEYCLEEVLASTRCKKIENMTDNECQTVDKKRRKTIPLQEKNVEVISFKPPNQHNVTHHVPARHNGIDNEAYLNVTNTSLLPLRDMCQRTPDTTLHKANHSPTVTMFSKNAMNEVYSMFNQNINEYPPSEKDETTNKFTYYENFTQEFTRPNMDDLTEVKPRSEDPESYKSTDRTQEFDSSNELVEKQSIAHVVNKSKIYPFHDDKGMMPIQEQTEHILPTHESSPAQLPKKFFESHFDIVLEAKKSTSISNTTEAEKGDDYNYIGHPLDSKLRQKLLNSLQYPLETYDTFYSYQQELRMSSLLKQVHKSLKTRNKNPIVEFKKSKELYCIRSQLGEGGYATVYLAESGDGKMRALKVEKPSSVWEFYILTQIEERLRGQRVLNSIVHVDSLHCFQDESYLILNYISQGTLLDLINNYQYVDDQRAVFPEVLCAYFSIELMKVVESLHEVGIIHGDLKPDNCMVRLENGHLGKYNSNNLNGWDEKGLFLIDFGRSFDLALFPKNTKFIADWRTDQQDCPEMRNNEPWSYEADYYGLAGIIHCMLYGQFIDTYKKNDGYWCIKAPIKRYWQKEIWHSIFHTLINSRKIYGSELPITSELKKLRRQLEYFLSQEGGEQLRKCILDIESYLLQRK